MAHDVLVPCIATLSLTMRFIMQNKLLFPHGITSDTMLRYDETTQRILIIPGNISVCQMLSYLDAIKQGKSRGILFADNLFPIFCNVAIQRCSIQNIQTTG